MMVDAEAMKRNDAKREFCLDIRKFVFTQLFSNRMVDNSNSLSHSVLRVAQLIRLKSIFQFNRSQNPVVYIVESTRYRH